MVLASTKKCSRCKEQKALGEFSPSRRHRDAYCRACRRARYRDNIEAERERARARAVGRGPVESTLHTCRSCQQSRPIADFSPSAVAKRTWGKCRECRRAQYLANMAKEHARASKRRKERGYHDAHYNRELRRRYGMKRAEYDALLVAQGGRCACCGKQSVGLRTSRADGRFHVDHDHKTGAIRGLLCHKCNIGIGAMGDDAPGVRRALVYLEKPDTTGIGAGLLF